MQLYKGTLFMLSLVLRTSVCLPRRQTIDLAVDSIFGDENQRPAPSDDLPIMNLIEDPDESQDPKKDDLRTKVLRQKLGKNFDAKFMSIRRPLDKILRPNGTLIYNFQNGRPTGRMPDYIKSFGNAKLKDGPRLKLKVNRKSRRKLRKFLWSFTYCPVQYTWKDLGVRFWPRWIRDGICYKGRSCSIPPGMSCKPSESKKKKILRWHCRGWNSSRGCEWIIIHYPIVSKCSCAC